MRKAIAIWMNLLVPGTGLILLRREWLGLAMAMLFCVCAQVGLWGMADRAGLDTRLDYGQ